MDIKLTKQIIKDKCGTVSFKKGEAFNRAEKVKFKSYRPEYCEATVSGAEDFQVNIEKKESGGFKAKCTCPSLASFQKDCQHIAAVLLAIYDHQNQEIVPNTPGILERETNSETELTESLLTLFKDQSIRTSRSQVYFETREMLRVDFTMNPVQYQDGDYLFSIGIKIEGNKVQNIREFLESVKNGNPYLLSNLFSYNPNLHCFQKENDDIIQQLNLVVMDEEVFNQMQSELSIPESSLLVPPSAWKRLVPLLANGPIVKIKHEGQSMECLNVSSERLPLRFEFSVSKKNGYLLKVSGLNELVMMNTYDLILSRGTLYQLESQDSKRLYDLKNMLKVSGTEQIPIKEEQRGFFLEKVVPGLKRLGEVNISEAVSKVSVKTPLVAKLYLDRVKNRLLAGLEFHYENIILNPLESRELPAGSMIFRDVQKEDTILELMEDSEFVKTEGGYFLHNEDLEYEFLYYILPKFEKLTQIYATTAVRSRLFKGNPRPQIRVKVQKERTNWLEFKFKLEGIPDQEIRDLLEALEQKRKYYRLRNGSLLSLESREFDEVTRFLNASPTTIEELEKGFEVPIVKGLQLLDTIDHQEVLKFEESFRQLMETLKNPDSIKFDLPKSLQAILHDYQKHGYRWLKTLAHHGFGGILADDMGLGKTLQSITFILSELTDIRKKKSPVLIVCPSSLMYNWLSEFMKFTPEIQVIVMDGNQKERASLQKEINHSDVVIVSYPLLRRDILWYEKQSFHTVFFDEAQAFKNPLTQTARAVKRIQAQHRFALTGTPVENAAEELWSIFHVVFPELFQGLKEYSHLSRAKIARRIRPFLLRRVKEEVLSHLPEKIEATESVELLPEQKKLYAAYLAKLRHDTLKYLDKDTIRKNRIRILAGLTRLRQICCHPALFVDGYKGGSAKFNQLMKILEESRLSGRRVLIFSQFTKMLELIGKELTNQGLSYFYLDGQTPSEERLEICNRFNNGERELFLISLKAGGTGLNLTGADTVILYDLWWNPAVEEQAADRVHRIGQMNTVQVIKLVSRGTIEEKINELQDKKRHLIEEIIDSEEKASLSLTEEDIREILML